MKKVFCLLGGVLLTAFSLLCFFEFFLAWNQADGFMELFYQNPTLNMDLRLLYPINPSTVADRIYWGHSKHFALADMLASFFGEKSEFGYLTGFLVFSREDWLQFTIFALIAFMLVVKFFKSRSSNKALSLAFSALAILAAWVLVKDAVEQWRYMFNDDRGYEMWQLYQFHNEGITKTRIMLNIGLHAVPQLLLMITFASMAWVAKSEGRRSVFLPVFFSIIYAGVSFVYNMMGIGFAIEWGLASSIIFLTVDLMLTLGLLFAGIGVKPKPAKE